MEDGITLATVLGLAGKEDVATAVRAFEQIRYQRVRRAQVTGGQHYLSHEFGN